MIINHYKFISQHDKKNRALFILIWSIIQAILDFIAIIILFPTIYSIFNVNKTESLIRILKNIGLSVNHNNLSVILISTLALYILLKSVISIVASYMISKNSFLISLEIIGHQIEAYSQLRYEDLVNKSNDIIAKDIIAIPIEFSTKSLLPFFQLISELIVILLITITILFIQPLVLILIIIFLGPFLIFTMIKLNSKIENIGREVDNLRPENFKTIYSLFNGYIDVLIANKISYFRSENIQINERLMNKYTRLQVIKHIPARVMETTIIFSLLLLYFLSSAFSIDYNDMIILFAVAAFRFIPSLNKISSSILNIKEGQYVYNRILKKQDKPSKKTSLKSIQKINSIELRNIEFNFYQKATLLSNVNITIKKGESIGIFGESGSGKSTIIKILLGLYRQQSGEMLINGFNSEQIDKISLYNQIGYIHQDYFILNKSIAENIAIGIKSGEIDEAKVWKCLSMVNLKHMVLNLKDRIHTRISDNGSNLSGGQRQRIVIARALYKNAGLIILDEATSSLDEKNSKSILNLIQDLKVNDEKLTSIIISHKISELDECDVCYNISNGTANQITVK